MNDQQSRQNLHRLRAERDERRRQLEQLKAMHRAADRNFQLTRSHADSTELADIETRLRHQEIALDAVIDQIRRYEATPAAVIVAASRAELEQQRAAILRKQSLRREERQQQIDYIRSRYPGSPEHHQQIRVNNALDPMLHHDKVAEADEAERLASIDAQLAILAERETQTQGQSHNAA
jgi:hypothetical protein